MDFYDILSDHYEDIFPLDNSLRQFALSLGIQKDDPVLDIGCATGEFAFFLSQFADRVYGIDSNRTMISKAVKYRGGCAVSANPQFLVADMLQIGSLFEERKFKYIFCLGNTLVHLEKERAAEVLRAAAAQLMPGGSLIFQILNYDRVFREGIRELPQIDTESLRFDRSYSYGEDRRVIEFTGTTTVKKTGIAYEGKTKIYPLLTDDLFGVFKDLHFQKKEIFGGYDFQCCTKDSFIVVGVLSGRL